MAPGLAWIKYIYPFADEGGDAANYIYHWNNVSVAPCKLHPDIRHSNSNGD
jgi:hypothetical protein